MSKVFASAAASGKRELVIKKESSTPESAAIEAGDYADLFSISGLNHLQISGFSSLSSISPDVGKLVALLQLTLTHDSLTTIPEEISNLKKLKHLDVSFNKITALPASLYTLPSLQALIVSNNKLTDDSFPPISSAGCNPSEIFPSLHRIDLLGNDLTCLPEVVYGTLPIADIVASDNGIVTLDPGVGRLLGLKSIDLKRNKLTSLPYELSLCIKLRSIGFEENPISDRRLLKLVIQHGSSKPKAILDYVASHSPKAPAPTTGEAKPKLGGASLVKRRLGTEENDDDDSEIEFSHEGSRFIQVIRPSAHVVVQASSVARGVRPYLVCAIIRGVNLSDEVDYKEFITLQTKLHDTLCKRRRMAAMATHNLDKITPPIHYDCQPAAEISLTPLNWSKKVTVQQFVRHLESCKVDKRGGGGGKKGRGGGSKKEGRVAVESSKEQDPVGAVLSKYLQFVDEAAMVYLQDNKDTIISLPPITNSEESKIDSETVNLFLEVSSSENLAVCKTVMDALVCGMCEKGLGVVDSVLGVEQVKVVDEEEKLLVLYPSRTDLLDSQYEILRPQ